MRPCVRISRRVDCVFAVGYAVGKADDPGHVASHEKHRRRAGVVRREIPRVTILARRHPPPAVGACLQGHRRFRTACPPWRGRVRPGSTATASRASSAPSYRRHRGRRYTSRRALAVPRSSSPALTPCPRPGITRAPASAATLRVASVESSTTMHSTVQSDCACTHAIAFSIAWSWELRVGMTTETSGLMCTEPSRERES